MDLHDLQLPRRKAELLSRALAELEWRKTSLEEERWRLLLNEEALLKVAPFARTNTPEAEAELMERIARVERQLAFFRTLDERPVEPPVQELRPGLIFLVETEQVKPVPRQHKSSRVSILLAPEVCLPVIEANTSFGRLELRDTHTPPTPEELRRLLKEGQFDFEVYRDPPLALHPHQDAPMGTPVRCRSRLVAVF